MKEVHIREHFEGLVAAFSSTELKRGLNLFHIETTRLLPDSCELLISQGIVWSSGQILKNLWGGTSGAKFVKK